MRTIQKYQEESDTFKCPDCGKKVLKKTGYCLSCKKKVEEPKKEEVQKTEEEKKNLYESVLQAITEIDVDHASCEDFLRIGISAEEGAITLYNRIASAIKEKKGENVVSKLFQHTAEEEKVHVGEFQRLLFDTDFEEMPAHEEGSEEVDEVIDDFVDNIEAEAETEIEEPLDYENVYTVYEDTEIIDGDKRIILEKGDRIQILKEFHLDTRASKILLDKGLKAYMEYRFGGESGYYDPENYTSIEVGQALAIELADALGEIASDVSDPKFENNYNWRDWTIDVLQGVLGIIKSRNYRL